MNKKILGVLLIIGAGVASVDYSKITFEPEPTYPEPLPALRLQVDPLIAQFDSGKANITGLFEAIAIEVEENRNLVRLSDLVLLNEIALERFLPLVGFERVAGLGAEIDQIILKDMDNAELELTPEIREEIARRYRALEWSVQQ